MDASSPASRTAFGAARHRAVHQVAEDGVILHDPLAVPVLGEARAALLARADGGDRRMRWFVCARARYAEAVLAAAVPAGLDQLVVLGAGLDTFGYRNPYPSLRVVELDHPATQAWKLDRLGEAGIAVPATVTHQAIDFESDLLGDVVAACVDTRRPVLFWWLGVTPYLTLEAITQTLSTLGRLPHAAVVLDHASPPAGDESPEVLAWAAARRERVAALGEPWLSDFEPSAIAALLASCGFDDVHLEDAAATIRRQLRLPPSPASPRTRLALGARGWPVAAQAARS
ncbi:MAG TPA: SAM-dependent methyltransferase [Nocardioides sp.]|nr:SAM-dependent methyltransferase [Nocardioides sp.]